VREVRAKVARRAESDLPGCIACLLAVHEADGYPSVWPDDVTGFLTPRGFLCGWIALRDSSVVGHIALCGVDEEADARFVASSRPRDMPLGEIKRLFVHPAARGARIAELLLEAAVREARVRALHPVLDTVVRMQAAMRCYERNGWRRIASSVATWQTASGEHPLLHEYELPEAALGSASFERDAL
jgi:ribosomal-protein-alanine N-acetyltransferase